MASFANQPSHDDVIGYLDNDVSDAKFENVTADEYTPSIEVETNESRKPDEEGAREHTAIDTAKDNAKLRMTDICPGDLEGESAVLSEVCTSGKRKIDEESIPTLAEKRGKVETECEE